jgi:hypothetical protein
MGGLCCMGKREQQSLRAGADFRPFSIAGSKCATLAYLSELYQTEEQHDYRRYSKVVQNHLRIL